MPAASAFTLPRMIRSAIVPPTGVANRTTVESGSAVPRKTGWLELVRPVEEIEPVGVETVPPVTGVSSAAIEAIPVEVAETPKSPATVTVVVNTPPAA